MFLVFYPSAPWSKTTFGFERLFREPIFQLFIVKDKMVLLFESSKVSKMVKIHI